VWRYFFTWVSSRSAGLLTWSRSIGTLDGQTFLGLTARTSGWPHLSESSRWQVGCGIFGCASCELSSSGPFAALRVNSAKDRCHFAQGKPHRESRPWIERTLFHWTRALQRSFSRKVGSG